MDHIQFIADRAVTLARLAAAVRSFDAASPRLAPIGCQIHNIVTGGMPGWEITRHRDGPAQSRGRRRIGDGA